MASDYNIVKMLSYKIISTWRKLNTDYSRHSDTNQSSPKAKKKIQCTNIFVRNRYKSSFKTQKEHILFKITKISPQLKEPKWKRIQISPSSLLKRINFLTNHHLRKRPFSKTQKMQPKKKPLKKDISN